MGRDAGDFADATGAAAPASSSSSAPPPDAAGDSAAPAAEDAFGGAGGGGRFACLDEELRTPAVKDLEALDDEYAVIAREHEAEHLELLRKFEAQCRELLAKRSSLLAACPEASAGALKAATPALPGFWRAVLQNSVEFEVDIERHDEPVLDFLSDLQTEWLDEGCRDKGFRIQFFFGPNPYFTNEVLEKTYHTERPNQYACRIHCTRIESTQIDWRPGRNVTVDVVSKKLKGGPARRRAGKAKKEEVPRESFFRVWFRSLGPDEELPEEELEREQDEEDLMECLVEDDYAQGLALRESIIPRAVRWFTGEACEDEEGSSGSVSEGEEEPGSGDGEEDDEEDEDEDDDEDEDEDEDEEAEERTGRRGASGGARGSGRAAGGKSSKAR